MEKVCRKIHKTLAENVDAVAKLLGIGITIEQITVPFTDGLGLAVEHKVGIGPRDAVGTNQVDVGPMTFDLSVCGVAEEGDLGPTSKDRVDEPSIDVAGNTTRGTLGTSLFVSGQIFPNLSSVGSADLGLVDLHQRTHIAAGRKVQDFLLGDLVAVDEQPIGLFGSATGTCRTFGGALGGSTRGAGGRSLFRGRALLGGGRAFLGCGHSFLGGGGPALGRSGLALGRGGPAFGWGTCAFR